MYLYLRLGVVDEEIEVFVLDIQRFAVVNIASNRNGDIGQVVQALHGEIHIKVFAVLLYRLHTVDTEYGSTAFLILGNVFYREAWVGRCPTNIETGNIHSLNLHTGNEGQCTTDGSYLHRDFQCLGIFIASILFSVTQHEVVHVIVAHLRIHILKQYSSEDCTVGREYHGLVAFR